MNDATNKATETTMRATSLSPAGAHEVAVKFERAIMGRIGRVVLFLGKSEIGEYELREHLADSITFAEFDHAVDMMLDLGMLDCTLGRAWGRSCPMYRLTASFRDELVEALPD